jgi:hypothetical protein
MPQESAVSMMASMRFSSRPPILMQPKDTADAAISPILSIFMLIPPSLFDLFAVRESLSDLLAKIPICVCHAIVDDRIELLGINLAVGSQRMPSAHLTFSL